MVDVHLAPGPKADPSDPSDVRSLSLCHLGGSNTPHKLRLDLSGFKRKNCNSLVTTRDDTDENLSMYSV